MVLIVDGKNLPPFLSAPKQCRHWSPGNPNASPLRFPCRSVARNAQGQNCARTANENLVARVASVLRTTGLISSLSFTSTVLMFLRDLSRFFFGGLSFFAALACVVGLVDGP